MTEDQKKEARESADYLVQEMKKHGAQTWATLGIECHTFTITDDRYWGTEYKEYKRKPVAIQLTGKEYAGLLAMNSGTGWMPVYHAKPNYPSESPWLTVPIFYETWLSAVLASLSPSQYLRGATDQDRDFAVKAAESLKQYRTKDVEDVLSLTKQAEPDIVTVSWMEQDEHLKLTHTN